MNQYTIWRGPRVEEEIGFSRSTILRMSKQGLFPQPVALGTRSVGWPAMEVIAINAARIRGESDESIKALVTQLEAKRKSVRGPADTIDPVEPQPVSIRFEHVE